MNAEELVWNYSELQAGLIAALQASLPDVQDWEMLIDFPKRGRIAVGEESWRYDRHGAGVRFVGERTGCVVDVHVGVLRYPTAVDAWRLCQYCESVGIDVVECCGRFFGAQDEQELDACLRELVRDGFLVKAPHASGLWLVASEGEGEAGCETR